MNFKKQEVTVACITVGLSGESDRQPGCIRGRIKKNREMTLPVRLIANPLSRYDEYTEIKNIISVTCYSRKPVTPSREICDRKSSLRYSRYQEAE
ncbi:TPA: hypothetical protein HNO49_22690 [Escherichia coli]|nr:hypothetical protein DAH29_22715 [Escherichia coli]HAJ7282010.1 hypothetical protein [Escherichia coli]